MYVGRASSILLKLCKCSNYHNESFRLNDVAGFSLEYVRRRRIVSSEVEVFEMFVSFEHLMSLMITVNLPHENSEVLLDFI